MAFPTSMHNMIVAIICLALISACNLITGNTTFNGLPSDNELRNHFNKHRKEFESLRNMILDDKKITVVSIDRINAAGKQGLAWAVPTEGGPPRTLNDKNFFASLYFNSLGIDKGRFDQYCELLQATGADVITKNGDSIGFQMLSVNNRIRFDERNILYSPTEQPAGLCNDTLMDQENSDRVTNATRLAGNDWFITYHSVTGCP